MPFDRQAIREYAYAPAGWQRAKIAKEWDFPLEEVDKWSYERVQYYLTRTEGLNAREHELQERQREKMEAEERGITRPDWLSREAWSVISDDFREKISNGGMTPRAVKKHIRAKHDVDPEPNE